MGVVGKENKVLVTKPVSLSKIPGMQQEETGRSLPRKKKWKGNEQGE